MSQILLRNNRRAATLPVLCGLALTAASGVLIRLGWTHGDSLVFGVSIACLGLALVLNALTLIWYRQNRLEIVGDSLRVGMNLGRGELVPLDAVECFFIGQSAGPLHASTTADGSRIENVTVVVRLAERAKHWHCRSVNSRLGIWADGYITVFGLWCEPIDGDFVKQMNHQLAAAKRASKPVAARGFGSAERMG